MIRLTGLNCALDEGEAAWTRLAARVLRVKPADILSVALYKRAVDARKKEDVRFAITLDVTVRGDEEKILKNARDPRAVRVSAPAWLPPARRDYRGPRPVVIGAGPAGLFAALTLARAGVPPLLIERGRPVEQRTADVERFRRTGVLDTASNVQFGEGGAGTFSDGKLTTGIKDPRCRFVCETLATIDAEHPCPDILYNAKPHVGTDRLRGIVAALRREILSLGGEVRFETQVTDLVLHEGRLIALRLSSPKGEEELPCERAILAIGHSARDTFEMLCARGVPMTAKDFAVGVRIEHRRADIDRALYGRFAGHPALGAAPYKLVCHPAGQRGVYTFCMCPGGYVMAASSEAGMLAVNGMSEYARDAENSNAALLVGVGAADFEGDDPLAGMRFQRRIERAAFLAGGGDYRAPAQTVGDFLARRASTGFGDVRPSYLPGVTPSDLRAFLPAAVTDALAKGIPMLGRQIDGFDRPDAVMTGVESRSSSPVRILRDETGTSAVEGLYPCGEGAGYAGGIVSAAVDGVHAAEWVLASLD